MRKSIIFHFSLFTFHLFAVAAPTANEDYVDRQDAATLAAAKEYADGLAFGDGGRGVDTNAVIDIANATIATNPVVAAKIDGPAVAPTDTAEAAGKAADAMLTGVALTNRYTKAETDAKLSPIEAQIAALQDGKLDMADVVEPDPMESVGKAADAKMTGAALFAIENYVDNNKQSKIMASGVLKGDGSGGVTPAEKSSTSADPANADYRDPQDNTCHKTEFGEWRIVGVYPSSARPLADAQPSFEGDGYWYWSCEEDEGGNFYWWTSKISYEDDSQTEVLMKYSEPGVEEEIMIVRTAVCTDAKKFVTEDVVDGKVSAAVSTNNPAFVSAVRNTPTSGMPEDMPTDWGTYGTVGAALAALAAFVKWAKAKIVAVIGDDGKPTDTFATDLLGKPVAKEAIDARLPYPLNSDGTIKDRAVNEVTSGAFVIPEGFKDLLIRFTGVPASITFSGADASIADYGDDLPTETGDYLITVTRTKAAECFIRVVKLEERT